MPWQPRGQDHAAVQYCSLTILRWAFQMHPLLIHCFALHKNRSVLLVLAFSRTLHPASTNSAPSGQPLTEMLCITCHSWGVQEASGPCKEVCDRAWQPLHPGLMWGGWLRCGLAQSSILCLSPCSDASTHQSSSMHVSGTQGHHYSNAMVIARTRCTCLLCSAAYHGSCVRPWQKCIYLSLQQSSCHLQ